MGRLPGGPVQKQESQGRASRGGQGCGIGDIQCHRLIQKSIDLFPKFVKSMASLVSF